MSSGTPLGSPFLKTSAPARRSSHIDRGAGRLDDPARGGHDLGADAVAGDQRDGDRASSSAHVVPLFACRGSVVISTGPMVAAARSRAAQVRLLPSGAVPIPQRTKRALFAALVIAAVVIGVVALRVIPDRGTSTTVADPATSAAVITVSDADAAPIDPKLGIDNINHFIFVVQENRSFDSYFGTFPGANGIPRDPDGSFAVCVKDDAGTCWKPYHDTGVYDQGGPHNQWASQHDIEGGAMDGFVTAVDRVKACSPGQMSQECRVRAGGQPGRARRDGVPQRVGHPELLGVRQALHAAGPDVRADRLMDAARRTCTSSRPGRRSARTSRRPIRTRAAATPRSATPAVWMASRSAWCRTCSTGGRASRGCSTRRTSRGRTTSATTPVCSRCASRPVRRRRRARGWRSRGSGTSRTRTT